MFGTRILSGSKIRRYGVTDLVVLPGPIANEEVIVLEVLDADCLMGGEIQRHELSPRINHQLLNKLGSNMRIN